MSPSNKTLNSVNRVVKYLDENPLSSVKIITRELFGTNAWSKTNLYIKFLLNLRVIEYKIIFNAKHYYLRGDVNKKSVEKLIHFNCGCQYAIQYNLDMEFCPKHRCYNVVAKRFRFKK